MKGTAMNKILRIILYAGSVAVFVLFILSILGIVSNNQGNSFGFPYRTDYTAFLLTLALAYVVVSNGWLTWIGELSFIALDLYVLWLGGKTTFICLTLTIIVLMVRHYRANGGVPFQDKDRYGLIRVLFKVLYIPVVLSDKVLTSIRFYRLKKPVSVLMIFCFPVFAVINYILIFTYRALEGFWNSIPLLSTFRDRFIYGLMGFTEYPLTLFGNNIPTDGSGESLFTLYYVLDSLYTRLLLQYGVIPFALVMIILTAVQVGNYKRGYYTGLFVMFVFSMSFLLEFALLNVLAVVSFLVVSWFYDKPDIRTCDRLTVGRSSPKVRWSLRIGVPLLIAVFLVWCSSAYKISSWRGWTPLYDATLVVPSHYSEIDDDLWQQAADYLDSHDDSCCIVADEESAGELSSYGIERDRVLILNSNNIDEMLTEASKIIEHDDLPPRLTVCAYSVEQARIGIHADRLGIHLNSLSVRPASGYLMRFTAEQWRILCGK